MPKEMLVGILLQTQKYKSYDPRNTIEQNSRLIAEYKSIQMNIVRNMILQAVAIHFLFQL
jgi:hypothetical protein